MQRPWGRHDWAFGEIERRPVWQIIILLCGSCLSSVKQWLWGLNSEHHICTLYVFSKRKLLELSSLSSSSSVRSHHWRCASRGWVTTAQAWPGDRASKVPSTIRSQDYTRIEKVKKEMITLFHSGFLPKGFERMLSIIQRCGVYRLIHSTNVPIWESLLLIPKQSKSPLGASWHSL